ncbi:MAG: hypothetical protein ACRDJO_11660 [Actinomycetota bacterium]
MDPTPPGELTASTEVVLHMRAGPGTKMVVTQYDPPQCWVWEGRSFGVTTRFEHTFEDIGEGRTRIWFLAWMNGPLAGPVGWIFGKTMHRYLADALPELKGEIEGAD